MRTYKTPQAILRHAYHLIDKKSRWCQGTSARDIDGKWCALRSDRAVAWCADGAIIRVSFGMDAADRVYGWLAQADDIDFVEINDEQGYAAVRRLFRKAAKQHGVTL